MHRRQAPLLTTAMLIAGALGARVSAQSTFEGVIEFRVTPEQGEPSTFVQTTKGTSMRVDFLPRAGDGEPSASLIIDLKTHTTTIVMSAQKMYMTTTASPADSLARSSRMEHDADSAKMTMVKTLRTETVAGVKCEIYHVTRTTKKETVEGEACMAKGVGFAMLDAILNGPRAAHSLDPGLQLFREMSKEDRRAMKMWRIADGKRTVIMEATRVDRSPVPASAFAPPEGYRKLEIPGKIPRPNP